jgi:uncharacterized membrane protein YkvA (DUF1232 family)
MSQKNANSTASGAATGNLMDKLMNASRLVFDSRVPFSLKLMLPIAATLYWLWPIDLMPGLPFDDIAVLLLALTFFETLATQAISKQQPGPSHQPEHAADANTVDTTWRVIE